MKEKAMKNVFFGILLAGAALVSASAQEPQAAPEKEGRIERRKENQQTRIAQGVASGQLTAKETANLERKEAGVNREIRNDRKANGGNLTAQERQQVNRQQNRLSRNIYRDKRNARVQSK
jgi:hypothetical protein